MTPVVSRVWRPQLALGARARIAAVLLVGAALGSALWDHELARERRAVERRRIDVAYRTERYRSVIVCEGCQCRHELRDLSIGLVIERVHVAR